MPGRPSRTELGRHKKWGWVDKTGKADPPAKWPMTMRVAAAAAAEPATGDGGGSSGAVLWPAYGESEKVLRLDENLTVLQRWHGEQCDFWERQWKATGHCTPQPFPHAVDGKSRPSSSAALSYAN